jgi:predicted RNA-binding Zn ribbon-like protein
MLDPGLSRADALLSTTFAGVCSALPDERLATHRLNRALRSARVTLQVVDRAGRWRVIAGCDPDAEAVAALAVLAVAGGWRRIKRCTRCGRPFIDRTNGASRRGCTDHPARR